MLENSPALKYLISKNSTYYLRETTKRASVMVRFIGNIDQCADIL